MSPSSNFIFPLLDKVIVKAFGIGDDSAEADYASRREKVEHIKHVLYDMDVIDAKSSALLTHVSIMLAVVAILLTSLNTDADLVWRIALIVELIAFSLVAMLLLRCVDVMGPPFRNPPDYAEGINSMYLKEILLRRSIYQLMVRVVFLLTLLLIVIVFMKFLL